MVLDPLTLKLLPFAIAGGVIGMTKIHSERSMVRFRQEQRRIGTKRAWKAALRFAEKQKKRKELGLKTL